MISTLRIGLLILVLGGVVLAFMRWRANYKLRPRYPRARNKVVPDSYQETNSEAKLLADVLALKERSAQWPDILKTLNPDDEPRIRTVLLELRWPHVFAPHTALNIIESICLSANRSGNMRSRLELLELAKSSMERVTRYGD